MSVGLNASQARANSQQDMIIFDETQAIMRKIIERSAAGYYEALVDDGTTMTESTPVSTLIGDVQNPVVALNSTFEINGHTVTLGQTSLNLNGIIADINDADIPGVTASKSNDYLVITIVHDQEYTWTYEVGTGTANLSLGIYTGVYTAGNPISVEYFNTWQGLVTDRALQQQMDAVMRHFKNLGYKIDRVTNTTTSKTFKWYVYW